MTPPNTAPHDVQVVVSRTFRVPVEQVFHAWLDPENVGKWLFATPTGTMVTVKLDPRVGGKFLIVEQRGDVRAEHHGQFLEIEPSSRIVFAFQTDPNEAASQVTLEFRPAPDGCELTLTHHLNPKWASFVDRVRGGWTKILNGLAQQVLGYAEVLITRSFSASRDRVFQAWSSREQLESWYAPQGCSIRFREFDFRTGGRFHSCITTPTGHECWCAGVFREIVTPSRIVMTFGVANAAGQMCRPVDVGMDPEWPAETVVTVSFDDQEGGTLLTLHQTVEDELAQRTGASPSWLQMFDRLDEIVAIP